MGTWLEPRTRTRGLVTSVTAASPALKAVRLRSWGAPTPQNLGQLVNRVLGGEIRVVIEKNNVPVAAVISVRDLAKVEAAEEKRQSLRQAISRMREVCGDVPPEEIERRVLQARARVFDETA